MPLFHEILKHMPVDIETAAESYGHRVDMQDDRQRVAFFHHWARLNAEFAGIVVDVAVARSREYRERMREAGIDPEVARTIRNAYGEAGSPA